MSHPVVLLVFANRLALHPESSNAYCDLGRSSKPWCAIFLSIGFLSRQNKVGKNQLQHSKCCCIGKTKKSCP
jgi:hypothetical protein